MRKYITSHTAISCHLPYISAQKNQTEAQLLFLYDSIFMNTNLYFDSGVEVCLVLISRISNVGLCLLHTCNHYMFAIINSGRGKRYGTVISFIKIHNYWTFKHYHISKPYLWITGSILVLISRMFYFVLILNWERERNSWIIISTDRY